MIEQYSPDELKEKCGAIVRSIVSMWIKDGDEAMESLKSWLSVNAKEPSKISTLEEILLAIKGDATEGIGLKIGSMNES